MEPIELTATTVEEALTKGAQQLGVPKEQVKATVLEQSKGLFGKGSVRVRLEVEEQVAAAPAQPAEVAVAKPAEAAPPAVEPVVEPVAETVVEPIPAPAPAAQAAEPSDEEDQGAGYVATDKDAEVLIGLLDGIFAAGNLNASATCVGTHGKYVNIEIDGRDVSYLVGRRGEVLNALQYLLNIVASRQSATQARAVIDGNDYRKRREDVLSKLALDIAGQVKERGEEAVLDALPAFERRIIHRVLVDVEGVTTYSEGEEPNRRVVIAPAG